MPEAVPGFIDRPLSEILQEVRAENRDPNRSRPLAFDPEWETVSQALEGWLHGIMLIAGQTNHGKSSLTVNLTSQILLNNYEHVFVMDFTLDDTLRRRLAIYVASMCSVRINDVLMEHRVGDDRILRAIDEGYRSLSSWEDSFRIYDTAEMSRFEGRTLVTVSVESLAQMVEYQINRLRQAGDNRRPMVVIDAINDLTTRKRFENDLQQQEYVVQQLVSLATTYQTPILCTSHSRKSTNWKNPNLDDVFGGSALKYAAQVVTFVYNDVVGRTSPDQSPMIIPEEPPAYYAGMPGFPRHVPVIVWHWRKNKTSSFVGRQYLKLVQWCNRVEMLPAVLQRTYDTRFSEFIE